MNLHRLRIWMAVAKRLSITKAADDLHIRQPSVTQQIRLLEKEYGLILYKIKGGRGIELTQAGKHFLKYAKKTLLQVDNLERDLRKSIRRIHRLG